jgi:zinc transporter, ZIP family
VENLGAATGWGLVVGGSLLAGGLVAAVTQLPERVAANVTAFGGGILLAAVALELIPDADAEAGKALTAGGLLAGTLIYVGADAWLNRDRATLRVRRSMHAAAAGRKIDMPVDRMQVARGESIAAGLFVDGVPESIALGLTIAESELGVALLVGIVVGNAVEAYGAAQPIVVGGRTRRFAIVLLGLIGLALALATVIGATLLADASGELIGTTQAVAAGAVLAVISIAVIPHAFEQVSSLVACATVAGFIAGYLLS